MVFQHVATTGSSCLNRLTVRRRYCLNMAHSRGVIHFPFMLGLRHDEILQLLNTADDGITSMCSVRRIVKGVGTVEEDEMKNESDPAEGVSSLCDPLQDGDVSAV